MEGLIFGILRQSVNSLGHHWTTSFLAVEIMQLDTWPLQILVMSDCSVDNTKSCSFVYIVVTEYCIPSVQQQQIHAHLSNVFFGRFSKEAKQKRNPYCFLPFGTGPRSCIGMRFALMEAKMALVYLLKRFSFQKNADTEVLVILVVLEVTRYSYKLQILRMAV